MYKEARGNSCTTATVINTLSKMCCIGVRDPDAAKKNPMRESDKRRARGAAAADQLIEFLHNLKEQEEAASLRKSQFVEEFRGQLARIPLKHRVRSHDKRCFILKSDIKLARGRQPGEVNRPRRNVTEWARSCKRVQELIQAH